MKKLITVAALAVAVAMSGFAATNTAFAEPTGPVPAASKASTTPAPAAAAPAAVEVSNTDIASCASKTLEEAKMTQDAARHIAIDHKMSVMGIDRTFAKGDTVWGYCKVALTDPVLADLALQVAKNDQFAKDVQDFVTQAASLERKMANLPPKAKEIYKVNMTVMAQNLHTMQDAINTQKTYLATAQTTRVTELAAKAAPKQQAAATPATPAPGAQAPAAKAKT